MYFRVMDNAHFDNLVCQALFRDGALAVVIGADPRGAIPDHQTSRPGSSRWSGAGVDFTDDDDRNALFYAIHPGGRAILDKVEGVRGLRLEKTRASRKVLADYGNMGSACA
ncbi:chalcone synthase-like [Oryza glaberrima]|uniref:chalcone synthase-like n=1 Tax=Oryza glaberrima TaxID=4538 RepID=UPI00224C02FE|nr:chalcone synthase-like [Oryza glaberrima]